MNQQDCDFLIRILSGNIEWIAAEMWLDNLKLKDCERIKNDLVADIVATKLTGGNVNFRKQRVLNYLQDKSVRKRGREMKELHLVLKHNWFDLFERGIKQEEYRENTPYWKKRIWDRRGEIHTLTIHKGYTDNTLSFKVKEIVESAGNPEWGAEPGKEYYVIKVVNELK